MAFTSAQLSIRIYARLEARFGKLPKPARDAVKKFTDALAEGVVEFFGEDVKIEVTTPGAPLPGGGYGQGTTSTGEFV